MAGLYIYSVGALELGISRRGLSAETADEALSMFSTSRSLISWVCLVFAFFKHTPRQKTENCVNYSYNRLPIPIPPFTSKPPFQGALSIKKDSPMSQKGPGWDRRTTSPLPTNLAPSSIQRPAPASSFLSLLFSAPLLPLPPPPPIILNINHQQQRNRPSPALPIP